MRDSLLSIDQAADQLKETLIRYIEATYHISDESIISQRHHLLQSPEVIHNSPYIESTPRYEVGKPFGDLHLSSATKSLFLSLSRPSEDKPVRLFNPPYTHQTESLELSRGDKRRSLVVMTGTGSGKTETFMMPILSSLVDQAQSSYWQMDGIRALVLYPMNALVNDQVGRLRLLLGDDRTRDMFIHIGKRPARFARYTSRTPYAGKRNSLKDARSINPLGGFYLDLYEGLATGDPVKTSLVQVLKEKGKWPAKYDFLEWFGAPGSKWDGRLKTHVNDVELLTRHEVQAHAPDVLVTNYSMLEYMLMRPIESSIFDQTKHYLKSSGESFLLIIDEAHLYRGASGAEVAMLIRRLRTRLGIPADRLQVIATSASFSGEDSARSFAASLTGKESVDFDVVRGKFVKRDTTRKSYTNFVDAISEINLQDVYDKLSSGLQSPTLDRLFELKSLDSNFTVERKLFEILKDCPEVAILTNETMEKALTVSEASELAFPHVEANKRLMVTSKLLSLASIAREAPDSANLLPCRIHLMFRGLPGLWACISPKCSGLPVDQTGKSPIGKLFPQPMNRCNSEGCNSKVYEFFTCRHCGTAHLRGYIDRDQKSDPEYIWNVDLANQSSGQSQKQFVAVDILLEEPIDSHGIDVLPLMISETTGAVRDSESKDGYRQVFIPVEQQGEDSPDDDEENLQSETNEEDDSARYADGLLFRRCPTCSQTASYGRSPIQDHQTKGDEPFEALVTSQIQLQAPNPFLRASAEFAPLRGRKVLTFSDSRQVAARLAPKLRSHSMQDSQRPLLVYGFRALQEVRGSRDLTLDFAAPAVLLAAEKFNVHIVPEMNDNESLLPGALERELKLQKNKLLDLADTILFDKFTMHCFPIEFYRALGNILTDRFLGVRALAIASITPKKSVMEYFLDELPPLPGFESEDARIDVINNWIRQFSEPHGMAKTGIYWNAMPDEARDGSIDSFVKGHATGQFRAMNSWLGNIASKVFNKQWLPKLHELLSDPKKFRGLFYLAASQLTLDFDAHWYRCSKCTFVFSAKIMSPQCLFCLSMNTNFLDPTEDAVFRARKGFYRQSTEQLLNGDGIGPVSINAREHTAQLNSKNASEVFSRAENYELWFQDIEINALSGEKAHAIDVLSCTTTMEVGIDIGSLTGVSLRNMPPSRSSYQQRAGRAGRRGSAISTVLAFASSDTHDEHFFSNPAELIRGKIIDPILTLDNESIAKRHVTAYVLQRYHQARIGISATSSSTPSPNDQLFEVLGNVQDFMNRSSTLNIYDLEDWILQGNITQSEIDDWLPKEIAMLRREEILKSFVQQIPNLIQEAISSDFPNESVLPNDVTPDLDAGSLNDDIELTDDFVNEKAISRQLLDYLLFKGLLPRYAFPTDVSSFFVFDNDTSNFRPEAKYSPSQSTAVALSQYAPGKSVYIDNKKWTSGAIWGVGDSRKVAWKNRKHYFECRTCGYARIEEISDYILGETKIEKCDACGGLDSMGRFDRGAMQWFRPPGFAHPSDLKPGTSVSDKTPTSYATRAKLMAPQNQDIPWVAIADRIYSKYQREPLIVSNTGPQGSGYNYCTTCGRIEPSAIVGSSSISGSHDKPFPYPRNQQCDDGKVAKNVALGTNFYSDILLMQFKADSYIDISPSRMVTRIALRTISESIVQAAVRLLALEESELAADFRPAIVPGGPNRSLVEIFMYDTLPGGAGFSKLALEHGVALFETALEILESCSSNCDTSCYRCLRKFSNKFEHNLLDRKLGASLLRHFIYGSQPQLQVREVQELSSTLLGALQERSAKTLRFQRDVDYQSSVGKVSFPLVIEGSTKNLGICFSHPLVPDKPADVALTELYEFGFEQDLLLSKPIDAQRLLHKLPEVISEIWDLIDDQIHS